MPRYLLAAEADKIQDFIFRAAKLREVVGGSRLLARFCDEGVKALKKKHDDKPEIIISDGGAFRLVFEDEDNEKAKTKAIGFGNDLAELYRRCAGGALTVAKPVKYDDSDDAKFKESNDEAQAELRKAKNKGNQAATAVHLPYIAFCASCGVALAQLHRKKNENDPTNRANYLCSDCYNKTEEKFDQDKFFVGDFYEALQTTLGNDKDLLIKDFEPKKRDWVDVICKADARNYVAYLIADGNGMGELFSRCNRMQLEKLSKELTNALRQSLVMPSAKMIKTQRETLKKLEGKLPVVPLILGGDDLFALLPAPFALDFARAFCSAYEENIAAALKKPEINLSVDKKPTIAAAIVICKSSYPHTLAHQRAEAALKQAKEMARRIEVKTSERVSTINFDIVTGNQVIADEATDEKEFRATLRPYFISDDAPSDWGINIKCLFDARFHLKALPGKRRSEFERLYADLPDDKKKSDAEEELKLKWKPNFEELLKRLGVQDTTAIQEEGYFNENDKLPVALRKTLKLLGTKQKEICYFREVQRALSTKWHGHSLPDLLEAWDFAYKLDEPASNYEEE